MPVVKLDEADQPRRIYAIGDIHGRLDLLERMAGLVNADLEDIDPAECLVVTLGDYVDRGENSRGVIESLIANPFRAPLFTLKGNHEEMLLTFLAAPEFGQDWRLQGGLETMHSYGLSIRDVMRGRGFAEAAAALLDQMPQAHLAFLNGLPTGLICRDHFFCHAGVRPGIPLERQAEPDLLWIRGEFLNSDMDFGRIVVHGHTPVMQAEIRPNRINVDTGAFMTGHLSCAVLEGTRLRIMST